MKPTTQRRWTLAATAVAFWAAQAAQAAPVTSITTDNPLSVDPNRASTSANLTSITTGGETHLSPWLMPVASATTTSTGGKYWGKGDSPIASVQAAFEDLDITTGQANSVNVVLFFESAFTDGNGTVPNVAILEISPGSVAESWTVEAIVGGTPASPVFGGTPLTFTQNEAGWFSDTGHQVAATRDGSETLNQDIYGAALDFADLGLAPTESLAGIRLATSAGDPSVVVGIVPEPASAALLAGLPLLMIGRGRRRRGV